MTMTFSINRLDKWKSGQVDKWTSGQLDKWTSGQVDKWTSGHALQCRSVPACVARWHVNFTPAIMHCAAQLHFNVPKIFLLNHRLFHP